MFFFMKELIFAQREQDYLNRKINFNGLCFSTFKERGAKALFIIKICRKEVKNLKNHQMISFDFCSVNL